jgi:hypothetical protein
LKRVVLISLIILTMAGAIGCAPAALDNLSNRTPSGRENAYSVQIDLVPSKQVYKSGEQIQMDLVLTNSSRGKVEPVILKSVPPVVNMIEAGSLNRQAQAAPPGAALPETDYDKPVIVKTFPAGTETKTLAVNEKLTSQLTWDQKNESGKQVSPGWYQFESNFFFIPESKNDISRDMKSSVRKKAFLIQYPQGAMTKVIEVNQSRTITGLPFNMDDKIKQIDVVFTLKRVELNEMGATFYLNMTSPNNPVSGYNNPEWTGYVVQLRAQYGVDGTIKEARAPNAKKLASGIELRWGASADDANYLDPVPSDAKELSFIIPEIRPDWKGSWEFKIPLN